MPRASAASASGIAAGAREIFRMWSRCSFSVTSKHSTWPSAAARGDHRDLALERHEGFEDRGFGAEVVPDLVEIVALADDRLALAVIAEAAGLDHRGQADRARSPSRSDCADETSA